MAIGIIQDVNTENWPEMTEKGSTKPGFGGWLRDNIRKDSSFNLNNANSM